MNRNYWKNREEKQRQIDIKNDTNIAKKLDSLYEKLIKELNGQINEWYIKYANKNGITMAEAKRQADSLDIEKYAKLAAQYVQEKDFSEEANEQMSIYNLTMKTNRLDLLMMNMNAEMVSTTSEVEEIMEEEIAGRGCEEVERQARILGNTVRNTAASVKTIANASFQSATWSERLWKNQDSLRQIVSKTMTNYLVKGISTNDAVKKLQGQLNKNVKNAAYCARRLVVTERQRVAKQTQMKIYEDCGVEWYEFITEPGCCPTCADLDGKKFKVKDQEAGVNLAPMHPNCRCSTCLTNDPTSDDPFDQWLEGFDEHGMTYEEWLEANGYSKDQSVDESETENSKGSKEKTSSNKEKYSQEKETTQERKIQKLSPRSSFNPSPLKETVNLRRNEAKE